MGSSGRFSWKPIDFSKRSPVLEPFLNLRPWLLGGLGVGRAGLPHMVFVGVTDIVAGQTRDLASVVQGFGYFSLSELSSWPLCMSSPWQG